MRCEHPHNGGRREEVSTSKDMVPCTNEARRTRCGVYRETEEGDPKRERETYQESTYIFLRCLEFSTATINATCTRGYKEEEEGGQR
jgi:hypothetical protein